MLLAIVKKLRMQSQTHGTACEFGFRFRKFEDGILIVCLHLCRPSIFARFQKQIEADVNLLLNIFFCWLWPKKGEKTRAGVGFSYKFAFPSILKCFYKAHNDREQKMEREQIFEAGPNLGGASLPSG